VAVTGGLHSKGQSLRTLVAALDLLGPGRVRVRCSGRLQDDYAREVFVKHPCVTHQWFDKMEDYFRLLVACDIIYNIRGDAENSYYRSLVFPQKLFDALAVGRPVVVAKENWVANWVADNRVGESCSFRDAEGLAGILSGCQERRMELPTFSKRARALFKNRFEWRIMEQVMLELYAGLQRNE
jgi:hypothetical protein